MLSFSLTLSEIQRIVDDWIKNIGGGYWPPLSMLAALMEEIGFIHTKITISPIQRERKNGRIMLKNF